MSIQDADHIAAGSTLEADVCIVGGGPAGITVALALARSDLSVVLLESGGTKEESGPQALNEGTNSGLPYYDLDKARFRVLGGSSERWAGWCRPMDPSDFGPRPWVSMTGWPISHTELETHYREAARLCQLDEVDVTANHASTLPPIYRPPFVGNDVGVATWQGSPPTKFAKVYHDDLESSRSIRVFTHATAVEVVTDDAGTRCTGTRVVTGRGNEFTVTASTVVLCAGAIETARLLLVSRRIHHNGLGNDHDLVGRNFMEHPHLVTARLELFPAGTAGRPPVGAIERGIRGTRERLAMQRPSGTAKVAYVIAEERRMRDGLLNFSTHIRTVSKVSREDSEAYQAFKLFVNNMRSPKALLAQMRSGAIPEGVSEQAGRLLRGLPEVAEVVYQEALKRPRELALYTQCEQVANPSSRVTIDDTRLDANGLPRVQLSWQLSDLDKTSVVAAHKILGKQFAASGLGVVVPEPAFRDDGPDWGPDLRGGHHHMGTTRMAEDARHGVVDRHGRVHSVHGLYVGDSAVFPTAGYANPFLTLVALAWRLGEHLRDRRR